MMGPFPPAGCRHDVPSMEMNGNAMLDSRAFLAKDAGVTATDSRARQTAATLLSRGTLQLDSLGLTPLGHFGLGSKLWLIPHGSCERLAAIVGSGTRGTRNGAGTPRLTSFRGWLKELVKT